MSLRGDQISDGPPFKRQRVEREPADRDTNKEMNRCDRCYSKHKKCEGPRVVPCSGCEKKGVDCLYGGRLPIDSQYVKWLEESVMSLAEAKGINIGKENGMVPEAEPSPAPEAPRPERVVSTEPASEIVSRHFAKYAAKPPQQRVIDSPLPRSATVRDHSMGGTTIVEDRKHATDSPAPNSGYAVNFIEATNSTPFYPQCRPFLNDFFTSIHHIYPILDGKQEFLKRCETLWASNGFMEKPSFAALYYSVVSLGALIGQRDEELIDGKSNMSWSTHMFATAQSRCGNLGLVVDLDMVQCYFFMALVCQHTMKPRLAYMYIGLAGRTALAMGLNQVLPHTITQDPNITKAETRTWWAIYALETEMSFCMRRPTALGPGIFHNRPYPISDVNQLTPDTLKFQDQPGCTIIRVQAEYARLLRRVCMEVYMNVGEASQASSAVNKQSLQVSMRTAASIEQDLDKLLGKLPAVVLPDRGASQSVPLKLVKQLPYVQVQKLAVAIKNHNLRMLLFASFLLRPYETDEETALANQCFQNCLASARSTIKVTYDAYQNHEWFRTWFHNCSYVTFAASVILTYMSQRATPQEMENHRRYVEKAIEILEVMDESSAANQAVDLIRRAVQQPPFPNLRCDQGLWIPGVFYWGGLDLINDGYDANFLKQMGVAP